MVPGPGTEQPLVLTARAGAAGEARAGGARASGRAVRLTQKKAATQVKEPSEGVGGKAAKGRRSKATAVKVVKATAVKVTAGSRVQLQERGGGLEARATAATPRKVFLPMVTSGRPPIRVLPTATARVQPTAPVMIAPARVLPAAPARVLPTASARALPSSPARVHPTASARVLPSSPARVLPTAPAKVPPAAVVKKTPVLLKSFQEASTGVAERNIPVILTSKLVPSYNDEPVNLSLKPVPVSEHSEALRTGQGKGRPAGYGPGLYMEQGTGKQKGQQVEQRIQNRVRSEVHQPSMAQLPCIPLHTSFLAWKDSQDAADMSKSRRRRAEPAPCRLSFSSAITMESVLTPSESQLSHSVSITPVRRQRAASGEPSRMTVKEEAYRPEEGTFVPMDVKQEPLEDTDPLDSKSETDIDDDEETYLQKMDGDMASMVQVKLECGNDDTEELDQKGYACPKCPRTYSRKQMCDLHMRKAHNMAKGKERCDICGVRFINVRAHKEKYHFFVDVDKCSLCGKVVKYLASHHCPLQAGGADKESKTECPSCGNLVKQKYLKIHQKNHCVGIRTSTFSNFRTVGQGSERRALQLVPREAASGRGPDLPLPFGGIGGAAGGRPQLREVQLVQR